jgi:hypothetical protein
MTAINLLPPEIVRRKRERLVLRGVMAAGVGFATLLAAAAGASIVQEGRARDGLAAERRANVPLRHKVTKLKPLDDLSASVQARKTVLASTLAGDLEWSKLLDELAKSAGGAPALSGLSVANAIGQTPAGAPSRGTITFQGTVGDFPGLADWLTRTSKLNGLEFVYLNNGQRQERQGGSIVSFSASANVGDALLSKRCQAGGPCP